MCDEEFVYCVDDGCVKMWKAFFSKVVQAYQLDAFPLALVIADIGNFLSAYAGPAFFFFFSRPFTQGNVKYQRVFVFANASDGKGEVRVRIQNLPFHGTAVDAYVVGAYIDSIYHVASPCVVIEIFVCQIFKSVVLVFALDLLSPVFGWILLLPLVPLPHIIFLVVGSFDELHHSSALPSGGEVSRVWNFLRFHCQTAQAEAHEQKHLREPIVS